MNKYIICLAALLLCSCSSIDETRKKDKYIKNDAVPEFNYGKPIEVKPATIETAPIVPIKKVDLYENIVLRHEINQIEKNVMFDSTHKYLLKYLIELPKYSEKQMRMPNGLRQFLRLNDFAKYNRYRIIMNRRHKNIDALKRIANIFERPYTSNDLYSCAAFIKQYLNYKLIEMEIYDFLYKDTNNE